MECDINIRSPVSHRVRFCRLESWNFRGYDNASCLSDYKVEEEFMDMTKIEEYIDGPMKEATEELRKMVIVCGE